MDLTATEYDLATAGPTPSAAALVKVREAVGVNTAEDIFHAPFTVGEKKEGKVGMEFPVTLLTAGATVLASGDDPKEREEGFISLPSFRNASIPARPVPDADLTLPRQQPYCRDPALPGCIPGIGCGFHRPVRSKTGGHDRAVTAPASLPRVGHTAHIQGRIPMKGERFIIKERENYK